MKRDLAHYEIKLNKMNAELAAQDDLGKASQNTVALDQQAIGRLSRMDAMLSQSMGKAQQTRRNQAKQRIGAALSRIASGEFGFCADCGEDIGDKRLEIDPTLPKCLPCTKG